MCQTPVPVHYLETCLWVCDPAGKRELGELCDCFQVNVCVFQVSEKGKAPCGMEAMVYPVNIGGASHGFQTLDWVLGSNKKQLHR